MPYKGYIDGRVEFSKPTDGLIQSPGFSNFSKLEEDNIKDFENADDKCWFEKNTRGLMLRPNLNAILKTMKWNDVTFGTGGKWKPKIAGDADQMPTGFEHGLLYQYDSESVPGGADWIFEGKNLLKENQGFIVWWTRWTRMSSTAEDLRLSVGGWIFEVGASKEIYIFNSTTWEVYKGEIPDSFWDTNTPYNNLNFMAFMFIRDYVVVGVNSFENTIAFKVTTTSSFGTDANGREYPILLANDSKLTIDGNGAIMIGFNQLYYEQIGAFKSPTCMPGATLSESPTAELHNSIVPTNCAAGVTIVDQAGSEATQEFKYQLNMTGADYGVTKAGYAGITPIIFSYNVEDPMARVSASASGFTLRADIISFNDVQGEGKDGAFSPASSRLKISGQGSNYASDILNRRNAQMKVYIESTLRATHYMNITKTTEREFGDLDITIEAQDVTKRCQNSLILAPSKYDGSKHGDVMRALAIKAGITLNYADYTADPVLPKSDDENQANWQFQKGANVWECMQQVRTYSGWILYSDNTGKLIYKPRPTSADAADYTLSTKHGQGEGIGYINEVEGFYVDWVRTRIWIETSASERAAGKYEKGGAIRVQAPIDPSALEDEIGETRVGIYIDPAIGNEATAKWAASQIYKWYKFPHRLINFMIPEADDYKDIWIYKIFQLQDHSFLNGKYLITGLDFTFDRFNCFATVTGMYLGA